MRMRSSVLGGLMMILIIFLGAPFIVGIGFQHQYNKLIDFYNSENGIHVKLLNYERGWLSSRAKLLVEWQPNIKNLPSTVQMTVKQYIIHGPIIYKNTRHLPSLFGLAAIQNNIELSLDAKKLLMEIGFTNFPIDRAENFMSFTGDYFQYLLMGSTELQFLQAENLRTHWQQIETQFWINPQLKRIYGQLAVSNVLLQANDVIVRIPQVMLNFDQTQDENGLWLGRHLLQLPELVGQNNEEIVRIEELSFNGTTEEKAGLINGMRQIAIQKIHWIDQWNDQLFGPLMIKLSAVGLRAKTIANIIKIYKKINETGELYRSQLKQNILTALPSLVLPGTQINLETFQVTTLQGTLKADGKISWPGTGPEVSLTLSEVIQAANMSLTANISKSLMQQLLQLVARSPYSIGDLSDAQQDNLIELQNTLEFELRQNQLLLTTLMQINKINSADGLEFLALQNNLDEPETYILKIKQLFLARSISLWLSYLLYWQYSQTQNVYQALNQTMNEYEQGFTKALNVKLKELIKAGIVKEEAKDYSVSLSWKDGVLKANNQ